MIQSKKILSAILLIGTFVACSNEDDTFLQEGEQQGARYTATVTAGIDNDGTRVALGESVNGVTKVLWSVGDAIALVDKANNNFVFERVQADGEDDEVTNATFTYDNSENPLPSIADIAYFGYPAILPSSWANQPGTADGLSQYMQLEAILPEGAESYDNLNLHFTHKTAVMKITLTHSDFIGQDVSLSINATGLLPDGGNRIMTDVVAVDENGTVTAYVVVPITGTEVVDLAVSAFINGESAYYTMIGTKTLVAGKLYKVARTPEKLVVYPEAVLLPSQAIFLSGIRTMLNNSTTCKKIRFVPTSNVISETVLVTDANNVSAYAVFNGETLEIHTIAKEFVADASSTRLFSGLKNITHIDFNNCFNTANVKNYGYMFSNCTSLTSLDLSCFNTENAQDMTDLFSGCLALTSLNLSNFNTSKVTDMSGMFSGCKLLSSIDVANFNTANVTLMNSMFAKCEKLATLNISNFSTTNVVGYTSMFEKCTSLQSLDLSNFDTSNAQYMFNMFKDCSSLTSLDLSKFNTLKVTTLENMFSGCSSLLTLDVSSFNTGNVKKMSGMFASCKSLTSISWSESFNTSQVVDMSSLFQGCSSLTGLDLSVFDTSNVIYMDKMFSGCSSLLTLDVSNFSTENVKGMSVMFGGTTLATLDLSNFVTSNVVDMSQMFAGGQYELLDLSNFDTSNVTTMEGLFHYNPVLTTILLGEDFKTDNVTDMGYMFYYCSLLNSLDLSEFNTSKVTDMGYMFTGCEKLTELDLANFNTSAVTNMCQMFDGCSSLTSLNISNFNIDNVGNVSNMFRSCFKLESLDLRSFSFDGRLSVTNNFDDMLIGVGSKVAEKPIPIYVTNEGYAFLTQNANRLELNTDNVELIVEEES